MYFLGSHPNPVGQRREKETNKLEKENPLESLERESLS